MVKCSDCGNTIVEDEDGDKIYHIITSKTNGGAWAGNDWKLIFCDKCNDKFERLIGRESDEEENE